MHTYWVNESGPRQMQPIEKYKPEPLMYPLAEASAEFTPSTELGSPRSGKNILRASFSQVGALAKSISNIIPNNKRRSSSGELPETSSSHSLREESAQFIADLEIQ